MLHLSIYISTDLDEIKKRNPKSKSKNQISLIEWLCNIIFFVLREKIIYLFRDYSFLISEAKCKAKYRSGLKILTSKHMLERSPVALVQVKANDTSGNLLNEIRQITYSLYWPKEIRKKSIKQYNEFNKVIKQNGYYIYEFWE